MPIVNKAEVLAYIGEVESSLTARNEGLIEVLMPPVEAEIRNYIGFDPVQATYTRDLPRRDLVPETDPFLSVTGSRIILTEGRGKVNKLRVPEVPLTAITTLHEDRARQFGADTLLTEGTNQDYWIDIEETGLSWTGAIVRVGSGWPAAARTVRVVYTAGLTTAQLATTYSDIKLATLMAMAKAYNESRTQQTGGNSLGGGVVISRKLGDAFVQYAETTGEVLGLQVSLPKSTKRILDKRYRRFEY